MIRYKKEYLPAKRRSREPFNSISQKLTEYGYTYVCYHKNKVITNILTYEIIIYLYHENYFKVKINKTISIDYELWTAFELYCKERNWKYSNAIESALEQMIISYDGRKETK